ncbi:hypothetical protein [Azospirillum sp. ST 5-10]|uniref:hypothetical protein n=1 Tax=unclassified Azospirillum TaxID=2630922 RepID=UPI003F4A1A5C
MTGIERLQHLLATRPDVALPLREAEDIDQAYAMLARIAAEHNIGTSAADIRAHVDAELAGAQSDGPLSDDQLDGVAGGFGFLSTVMNPLPVLINALFNVGFGNYGRRA